MNSGVKLKGYTQVTGSDTGLTQALATIGPITAYIYAGSMNFAYNKSGIYSDTACTGQTINHAVMLVGYAANATGTPYYILRNSWGTTWGMNGYMYISRGNNMCSVASYNYYPKNVTLNSNLTTVAPLITTTTPSKTNSPLNTLSTAATASTTSTAKTTTYSVLSTSKLTPSSLNKTCTNGSGYYAYSGCQNYYYCLDNIYNSYCPTGYIFDQVNQYCTNTNLTCLVTPGICMNGTGWYTYPGCNSVYYCTRTITNYTTPSASTLFNPSTNSFVSSSNFKCPF